MLDHFHTIIQPVIVDLLLAGILGVIAFAMRHLPERWQMDIEAKHRAALHQALETGVDYALNAAKSSARGIPAVGAADALVERVVSYTQSSVPDALKRLAPSRQHLERMARAKIQERLDALTGRDRLKEALDAALTGAA